MSSYDYYADAIEGLLQPSSGGTTSTGVGKLYRRIRMSDCHRSRGSISNDVGGVTIGTLWSVPMLDRRQSASVPITAAPPKLPWICGVSGAIIKWFRAYK